MNTPVKSFFISLLTCIPVIAWGDSYTGSGFFISQDGYFVTNYHVISGSSEIQLRDINGRTHKAAVVKADKANDLVILKADGNFNHLAIANSRGVKRGSSVITVGYPHIDVQGIEPKVTEGIISSLSGVGDDPRVYQISAPVQSGNSGGPLVTNEGNVIGIVVSKLSASTIFKETGDVPQNVNYAVKSNYLSEVISSIPELDQKLKNISTKTIGNLADLTAYVEKATAIVVARQNTTEPSKVTQRPMPSQSTKTEREPDFKSLINSIRAGQYTTDGISINAPSVAENGWVVPLEIISTSPLVNGETLYITVNDQYVSHIVTPQGSIELHKFSIRSKMPQTGYMRGIITDKSNNIRSASIEVRVGSGATMSSAEPGGEFTHKLRSMKNRNTAEIKMLLNSPMSNANHVKTIKIKYGESGSVVINMTPAASKNPFVGITTASAGYSDYDIEFTLNNGLKSTGSGSF